MRTDAAGGPYPRDRRHWWPLLVFVAVAVGAPWVEIRAGRHPGAGIEASATEVIDGTWARRVDAALAQRGRLVELVRPWIATSELQWFEGRSEKVVIGDDGWLFLASTVRGYPPPRDPAFLAAEARIIANTIRTLRYLGIRTFVMLVPNKASLHPDRLPADERPGPGSYATARAALEAAGVPLIDLQPVIDHQGERFHYRSDTHWTWETAGLCAHQAAKTLRPHLGHVRSQPLLGGVLGPREIARQGDLVKMLGIRPGSSLDASYAEDYSGYRIAFSHDGPWFQIGPVTVVGTSFSQSFDFHQLLSVVLDRRVGTLSRGGGSSGEALMDYAWEVARGEAAGAGIVIWEFPERHWYEWRVKLTTLCRDETAKLIEFVRRERPLTNPLPLNCEVVIPPDGLVHGRTDHEDPSLLFELLVPVPGDGSWELSYEVQVGRPGTTKVLFDDGAGFREDASARGPLRAGAGFQAIAFPVEVPGGKAVHRIRIDPQNARGGFKLRRPRLRLR